MSTTITPREVTSSWTTPNWGRTEPGEVHVTTETVYDITGVVTSVIWAGSLRRGWDVTLDDGTVVFVLRGTSVRGGNHETAPEVGETITLAGVHVGGRDGGYYI